MLYWNWVSIVYSYNIYIYSALHEYLPPWTFSHFVLLQTWIQIDLNRCFPHFLQQLPCIWLHPSSPEFWLVSLYLPKRGIPTAATSTMFPCWHGVLSVMRSVGFPPHIVLNGGQKVLYGSNLTRAPCSTCLLRPSHGRWQTPTGFLMVSFWHQLKSCLLMKDI